MDLKYKRCHDKAVIMFNGDQGRDRAMTHGPPAGAHTVSTVGPNRYNSVQLEANEIDA